jgi:hypothetical protein
MQSDGRRPLPFYHPHKTVVCIFTNCRFSTVQLMIVVVPYSTINYTDIIYHVEWGKEYVAGAKAP